MYTSVQHVSVIMSLYSVVAYLSTFLVSRAM